MWRIGPLAVGRWAGTFVSRVNRQTQLSTASAEAIPEIPIKSRSGLSKTSRYGPALEADYGNQKRRGYTFCAAESGVPYGLDEGTTIDSELLDQFRGGIFVRPPWSRINGKVRRTLVLAMLERPAVSFPNTEENDKRSSLLRVKVPDQGCLILLQRSRPCEGDDVASMDHVQFRG